MTDATAEFFGELGRRGHDELLHKTTGTLRFDIVDEAKTVRWFVTVERGDVAVTRRSGPADLLIRAGKPLFDRMAQGEVMFHSQIGYRQLEKSTRAYAEIYERLQRVGYRIDRYGICLDWNMGYPSDQRSKHPRGTGMILKGPEDFRTLTHSAPIAPHFGDFMIGMPAAVENVAAALQAGSTSIGNLGQYFTYRLPQWHDEIDLGQYPGNRLARLLALCKDQSFWGDRPFVRWPQQRVHGGL